MQENTVTLNFFFYPWWSHAIWDGVSLPERANICLCVRARVRTHTPIGLNLLQKWNTDISVSGRPFVLRQEPSAAFLLVNCHERSVKGGPQAREGVAGVSPGGSPHRRGKLVTDLLGFQGPLCGLLQGKVAPFTRGVEQRRVGLNRRRWRIGPCSRERRQDTSFAHSSPLDQMFHVSEILAQNKLSYCMSTAVRGKWEGSPFDQRQINLRQYALKDSSMC